MSLKWVLFRSLRVTFGFRERLTSWGTKEKVVRTAKRWLDLNPLPTRVPFHISKSITLRV
jgi:hypothetical protein